MEVAGSGAAGSSEVGLGAVGAAGSSEEVGRG